MCNTPDTWLHDTASRSTRILPSLAATHGTGPSFFAGSRAACCSVQGGRGRVGAGVHLGLDARHQLLARALGGRGEGLRGVAILRSGGKRLGPEPAQTLFWDAVAG